MKHNYRKICISAFLVLSIIQFSAAQIMRVGVKAGPQMSWVANNDPKYEPIASVRPATGFHAGFVMGFKVKDRYFLNLETMYSQKGKIVRGKEDSELHDKVVYHHLDIPVLFSMHFKGKLSDNREFKWYLNAGPTVSYWLGGKGTIKAGDLIENGLSELKYKMVFGERPEEHDASLVYINNANRWQFSMSIGGGLLLEPVDKQKVLLDFRYDIGHTRMGSPTGADYLLPALYDDNLKARHKVLRVSLIYLMEFTSDKKERNKGKSKLKPKF